MLPRRNPSCRGTGGALRRKAMPEAPLRLTGLPVRVAVPAAGLSLGRLQLQTLEVHEVVPAQVRGRRHGQFHEGCAHAMFSFGRPCWQ
ncbi:hypothetical protein FRAHR75_350080 [Frankia sp. Hr75.2]|nr:hypothetical protein FRAHR75_350080 [Frankia sp. Hr75.2]